MTAAAPSVPERFEPRQKAGAGSVHPGQFVDEHHLARTIVTPFQQLFQQEEGLHPRLWLVASLQPMTNQGEVEVLELRLQRNLALAVIR